MYHGVMIQTNTFLNTKDQNKSMNKQFLAELGLSPKEVDVYLALLTLESTTIFEIKNKAKVSRMSIYEILQKLLDKGLISFAIKDGKKHYQAANPERLRDLLKEKEATLENLLPELLSKFKESKSKTNVEVFVGKEGMKTITNKILKVGKPICVMDGEGRIFEFLKYYLPRFIEKRVKSDISAKVIYCESFRKNKFTAPITETRYVSQDYASPTSITIYGDNVNLLIFSENPIAIHIQSREVAKSYLDYFNLMWNVGKK